MKHVAVIGLGKMGSALATRILQAGYRLSVYNRTPSKMQPLVELGAEPARSVAEAVTQADVIITSLFDDQSVKDVVLSADGILAHMKPSAIHVGLSTILPATADEVSDASHRAGRAYISGAVLGVPKVALEGGLTLFCAGDAEKLAQCEAVLQSFGQSIIYLGHHAKAALIMKISMNYALITTIELVSELYAFAEKSGLDLEVIQKGLHQIYAHPAYKRYIDKIKDRDFDQVNFDVQGGFKDVSIFQEAFSMQGVVPHLGNLVKDRYISALAHGMENKDWSALYEVVRLESGLPSINSK